METSQQTLSNELDPQGPVLSGFYSCGEIGFYDLSE
jgi:hypothetical protein